MNIERKINFFVEHLIQTTPEMGRMKIVVKQMAYEWGYAKRYIDAAKDFLKDADDGVIDGVMDDFPEMGRIKFDEIDSKLEKQLEAFEVVKSLLSMEELIERVEVMTVEFRRLWLKDNEMDNARERFADLLEIDELLCVARTLNGLGVAIPELFLARVSIAGRRARSGLSQKEIARLDTMVEVESGKRLLHVDEIGHYLWTSYSDPGLVIIGE